MTPYDQCLIAEQLRRMDKPIEDFLDSYATHRGQPNQKSVIFFPGGLASELTRANEPFDPNRPVGSYTYETIWVDLVGIRYEHGALLLQMNGNEDSGQRLILADGPLKSCVICPYDDFANWCTNNNLDLLMFGWDFRRTAAFNVDFFLATLVPEIQRRAQARGWQPDEVFANATMIGHSFGGMLAKWIMNKHAHPFCQNLKLAVSVGTPFYGYTSHTERMFTGEPLLGPHYDLDEITKCIATLPGGFALFFLDGQTYDTYGGALFADPDYPLDRYPSFDKNDHSRRVDPYAFLASDPMNANRGRYPITFPDNPDSNWTWFQGYLSQGKTDYQALAADLDPAMNAKFHSIRGVQTQGGQDAALTKIMQQWDWYDFRRARLPQADTTVETFGGPGDGCIPAWSARLVTLPQRNVHTIKGEVDDGQTQFEHMTLMSQPTVQAKLLALMADAAQPADAQPANVQPDNAQPANVQSQALRAAPREELQRFMKKVSIVDKVATRKIARPLVRHHVNNKMNEERRRQLLLRWYIELPKGRPPKYDRIPESKQPRPPEAPK
jgi:pimeloyl-ACP methyl ester carboxylesterase